MAYIFFNVLRLLNTCILEDLLYFFRWCPCFLAYLLTTFPSIWLLQISQYNIAVGGSTIIVNATILPPQSERLFMPLTNATDVMNATTTTEPSTTEVTTQFIFVRHFCFIQNLWQNQLLFFTFFKAWRDVWKFKNAVLFNQVLGWLDGWWR